MPCLDVVEERKEERRKGAGEKTETYIFQITHDIIKKFSFLKIIPHLLDRIFRHQILCDFRPHLLLLVLFPNIPPSLVDGLDFPRGHQFTPTTTTSVLVFLRDEFAASNAVIALPRDFFLGAADAFHLYSLSAGRDVDNGPIFVGAVVAFAEVGALGGAGIVVVGFFGDVEFVAGAVCCAGAGVVAR